MRTGLEPVTPYNVHEYIGEICNSFKNVIAQITAINKESVSVSFIYKYVYELDGEVMGNQQSDKDWRWVIGREQTMQTPLNNFVNQNDTVYHTLLGKDTVVFYNDKQNEENNKKYYKKAEKKGIKKASKNQMGMLDNVYNKKKCKKTKWMYINTCC